MTVVDSLTPFELPFDAYGLYYRIWVMVQLWAIPPRHECRSLLALLDELQNRSLKVRRLHMDDFQAALARIKSPVTQADLDRFAAWSEEFGEDFS